jgi:hypothetical protein
LKLIVRADFGFGDYIPQRIGPKEFLNLVKYAKYVCTDSFHCSVFSILYMKDFFVFHRFKQKDRRGSTNSRINSLLSVTGLEDRLTDDFSNSIDLSQQINYGMVKQKINAKRMESIEYLHSAINNLPYSSC